MTNNVSLFKGPDGAIGQRAPKKFFGRVVLFLREKLGFNKQSNREITREFIESIKSHYGDTDPGLADDLARDLEGNLHSGKALTLRTVRQVLDTAEAWSTGPFADAELGEDVSDTIFRDKM